jgi:hypothetical protein
MRRLDRVDNASGARHLPRMRGDNLLARLLRVLTLAAVGLFVASGMAFAHSGHAAAPAMEVRHQAEAGSPRLLDDADAHSADATAAEVEGRSDVPCAPHEGAQKPAGCCTIACHAALQTQSIEAIGATDPVADRLLGSAGLLVGRTSDCTERPPKRA